MGTQQLSEIEARLHRLMVKSQQGDRESYRGLLEECQRLLHAFFARRFSGVAGSQHISVDDLVQESLLGVHTKLGSFDAGECFTPWLYAIGRYKLIDCLRRRKIQFTVSELDNYPGQEFFDTRLDLNALLKRLPDQQQEIVRLSKIEELSMEEISGATGLSVANVKVSLHRALKRLSKDFLEKPDVRK